MGGTAIARTVSQKATHAMRMMKKTVPVRRNLSMLDLAASPAGGTVFSLHELNDAAKRTNNTTPFDTDMKVSPAGSSEPPARQRSSRLDPPSSRIRASFIGNHDETVRLLAAEEATAVSLNDLYTLGQGESTPQARLQNAQFLYHELPIRMSQRVEELRSLPYGLSEKESIKQVATLYSEYVRKMINFGEPTADQDHHFTKMLESLFLDQGRVIERMAQGVIELRQEIQEHPTVTWDQQIQGDVTQVLDRFFTARIGLRLLVEQHFRAHDSPPGFSGAIESNCSPESVAKDAIADASYLCDYHMGRAPEVALYGTSDGQGFTYLPSHMRYVLLELLKNAMRSTVERHGHDEGPLPMVQIMVAHGAEDVTFKICDEGGGIPRSEMGAVWTYLHSSAQRPPVAEDLKQENRHTNAVGALAGYGMGLPLSRIYAQYFGGNLDIKSMEGFGTDCYLYLCRLGVNCENLPTKVKLSPPGSNFTLASYADAQAAKGSEDVRKEV
eukprot:TRINITY_DN11552_c0_g1_i1.p1 TRINITY_DN11552_c0_g1~~TRINITY_DN11552_c0_g1_i1.p1  ORF type:complete len:498 (+),score=103.64 TRINITY_DN11552_c0_g1_i1:63-1556(+)